MPSDLFKAGTLTRVSVKKCRRGQTHKWRSRIRNGALPNVEQKIDALSVTTRTDRNSGDFEEIDAYEIKNVLGTTSGTTLGANSRPAGQGKNAEALSATDTSGIQSRPG